MQCNNFILGKTSFLGFSALIIQLKAACDAIGNAPLLSVVNVLIHVASPHTHIRNGEIVNKFKIHKMLRMCIDA